MDHVVDDRAPVVVTRQKAETLHLLSTPANADRLRRAVRELDAGAGGERTLVIP